MIGLIIVVLTRRREAARGTVSQAACNAAVFPDIHVRQFDRRVARGLFDLSLQHVPPHGHSIAPRHRRRVCLC